MNNNLYVVSNLNMETVDLVASCLSKRYKDGFERIVFFETLESEKYEYEQMQIYRKYFGNFEKNVVLLNDDGSIPAEKLYSVFEYKGNKVIDLSNGPKVTTSSIYLASALCRLQDVYCLILHSKPSSEMNEGKDYNYLKIQQMQGIDRLAKLSYFDLIYYTEEVKILFSEKDLKPGSTLQTIYNEMIKGISGFFTGELDPRSVINCLTIGNESIVKAFLLYLKSNTTASNFARKNNIDLNFSGDPIGIISRFCKTYVRSGDVMNLVCLCTMPGLLSGLRDYRNISAHYTSNRVVLTNESARTVINMQIEVLKCIHENTDLWSSL